MNEWSPDGFCSGSATSDQRTQPKVGRQYWEGSWDKDRANPNLKDMNGYCTRERQNPNVAPYQVINEDFTKDSNSFSMKRKSCASDPRFKRVISSYPRQNNSYTESDNIPKLDTIQGTLQNQLNKDKLLTDQMMSYSKNMNNGPVSDDAVTKDVGFSVPTKYVGGYDSFRFSNNAYQDSSNFGNCKDSDKINVNFKTTLKRSMSDCTLNTRNNFADGNEDEPLTRIRNYPSGTNLGSVHEWIRDNQLTPEKRRSVITVIGQTQAKSLNQILSEINQRRKLAKELDKHALCKAIMETAENRPEVKNLVAKIDFVLPSGEVIYSTEKVYLCKDKSKFKIEKDCGEYTHKSMEILQVGDQSSLPAYNEGLKEAEQHRKRCEMIPERDSSVTQVGKRNRSKRLIRKSSTPVKEKESLKYSKLFCKTLSFKVWWSVCLFAIVLISAFFGYVIIKPSACPYISEFFKPKSTAWYEKLLY